MSLKQKTVSGLMWSFLEDAARSGILFVCGVVLARLLTPREFGLIGMTTVFIAVSQSLVDSGFTQALIRKQNCTPTDYATVFFFNALVGLGFCLMLAGGAGAIGRFFGEPDLPGVLRALSLGLVLGALGQVQRIQITKALDFELLMRISILSSTVSGGLGIIMAVVGYGVWSLVAMTLSRGALELVLLWLWRKWRPAWTFDWEAFKEMFAFGSRLMASGLINTFQLQMYNLVIGKFFSAADLGQFTQAQNMRNLPSQRLTMIVQRVSYPVLATLQNDTPRLKAAYRRLIRSFMLVAFALMVGLAACAEALILALVGEQWRPAISYLQLLCFVGMLYPLHAVNQNILLVCGRSDQFLKLSVIKTALAMPALGVGVFWGIPAMIVAMFAASFIGYLLTASWSGQLIGYRVVEQLRDLLPPFALAIAVAAPVHFLGQWLPLSALPTLVVQVAAGATLALALAELTRPESYVYLKEIAMEKLKGGGPPQSGTAEPPPPESIVE